VSDSDQFDPWKAQVEALGRYLRTQRQISDLSLRELARMTNLSNAYISQLERGLHEPSLRVLRALADALGISLETLLAHTGLGAAGTSPVEAATATEAVIRSDANLSEAEKEALLAVYRSYVAQGGGDAEQ
jgi:transcriptional regulator with XRE-family HTH domain